MTHDDLGPGLHVLHEADPIGRAGSLAVTLRGDLCATDQQAAALLAERSALAPVEGSTIATLYALARRLDRAQRIVGRTRARALADVGDRLAGAGMGLVVHPATIRERASAVEEARAEAAEAEALLAEKEAELAVELTEARRRAEEAAATASASITEAAKASAVAAARDRYRRASLRVRRSRAIGALLASFGAGLLLVAVKVALWGALLPALVTSLWAIRYLRPPDTDTEDQQDRAQASTLLSLVGATTDEVFGLARSVNPDGDHERSLLTARRDLALERVRVAERGWRQLAGDGVDVSALEEVVRRHDPQHEDSTTLVGQTVGVRAAEAVARQAEQRWVDAWAALGLEAPAGEDGEEAVRALEARATRPIVLVGDAAVRGAALAEVAPAAAVVVLMGADEAVEDLS
ncbi:MAG: hypothetical protein ACT4OV_07000 [Microthrixaceae bacterium]